MNKNEELLKKLRAGNAAQNNGAMIRDIHLLRPLYMDLKSIQRVRSAELSEQEFLDSINYLSQEGYLSLRDISSKTETRLCDADYLTLEALVTSKGIRLLDGVIVDELVDV